MCAGGIHLSNALQTLYLKLELVNQNSLKVCSNLLNYLQVLHPILICCVNSSYYLIRHLLLHLIITQMVLLLYL